MIGFDVRELANSLLMEKKEFPLAKEAIVQELITMAVEISNYPHRENSLLDAIEFDFEMEYGIPRVHDLVRKFVKHINIEKKKRDWDPRLLVKVEFRSILRSYHRTVISMDLENTFLLRNDILVKAITEEPEISEMVDANPNLDDLNELLRKIDSENRRKPPVLSNRHKRNVVSIKGRG